MGCGSVKGNVYQCLVEEMGFYWCQCSVLFHGHDLSIESSKYCLFLFLIKLQQSRSEAALGDMVMEAVHTPEL